MLPLGRNQNEGEAMGTYKQLLFNSAAREKLLRGANQLADAVRVTLGPKSKSVLIEKKWGQPLVCNDGLTIVKELELKDPEENLGARMLRQAAVNRHLRPTRRLTPEDIGLQEALDLHTAQVLMTLDDSRNRRRYLNSRATVSAWLLDVTSQSPQLTRRTR